MEIADEELRRPVRPRVGRTGFLNCVPLFWGLARTAALLSIDLVEDTPDALAQRLLAGDLDVATVPVADYLLHRDRLVLLPGIATSSDGPVMSCAIVSKVPIVGLEGRTFAIASSSPTCGRLAQLLLKRQEVEGPRYVTSSEDLRAALQEVDAIALTGDEVLRYAVDRAARGGLHVYDLGALWRRWTGLPFVFGVWAVRRDVAARAPHMVREVHGALLAARDLAMTEAAELARRAAEWEVFDAATLEHYFTRALDYSLSDRQLAGLTEFARCTGHEDFTVDTTGPSAVFAPVT
ncbi:menaquinone biosynthetic enzyme MqnA/MqnD family protein [Streptomyces mutabilis]|uniref:menaquinone biosynthetic enzyme MqnA/MqnD family protein n=1 Tax=Streptomyces TaxID=1883 RepID=UPI0036A48DC4